jgi:hypothetical protein
MATQSKDTRTSAVPDDLALAALLERVLGSRAPSSSAVRIIDRQPNVYASTFVSEVVTCQVSNGRQLRVFCKYSTKPAEYRRHEYGPHRGVGYEAEVYRQVLQHQQGRVPRFLGLEAGAGSGGVCLFLECIDDYLRVDRAPVPDAIRAASTWCGRFHAAHRQGEGAGTLPAFLAAYDADYYLGWAQRALRFAASLRGRYPWMETVCDRFGRCAELLLAAEQTVIHGEFTAENLLYRDGGVYPVDWESAAVAAGEIDVAVLTDQWDPEIVKLSESDYARARWPEGPPGDFERTLAAARAYWALRWLGDREEWTLDPRNQIYFEQLRTAAEPLGLLS